MSVNRGCEMKTRGQIRGLITERRIQRDVIDAMYSDGYLYAAFGEYFRRSHGYKMFKIPIDCGSTCPNWDGRLSSEGCLYCPDFARQFTHESFRRVRGKSLKNQVSEQVEYHKATGAGEKFLLYIAFGTNTYRPIKEQRMIYDTVLEHPDTVGLSIGTRPDCLPDEVLDLLQEYVNKGFEMWIEIGQQSFQYHTCETINRKHGTSETMRVVREAHKRGILVSTFSILGLPYETPSEMIENARIISELQVDAVKIYPLLVMKNTRLAGIYVSGGYRPVSRLEYISLVSDFLEHLSPYVLIQRISKDAGVDEKIAPEWNTHRFLVGPEVEKALLIRGTMQGSRYRTGLSLQELKPMDL